MPTPRKLRRPTCCWSWLNRSKSWLRRPQVRRLSETYFSAGVRTMFLYFMCPSSLPCR